LHALLLLLQLGLANVQQRQVLLHFVFTVDKFMLRHLQRRLQLIVHHLLVQALLFALHQRRIQRLQLLVVFIVVFVVKFFHDVFLILQHHVFVFVLLQDQDLFPQTQHCGAVLLLRHRVCLCRLLQRRDEVLLLFQLLLQGGNLGLLRRDLPSVNNEQ
jgi:hypothetical protein